jgi:hypothetical protein
MMDAQNNKIPGAKRHPEIDNGALPATGASAYVLLIAVFALLAAGTAHLMPVWGTVLTGTFWFAFSVYWGIA